VEEGVRQCSKVKLEVIDDFVYYGVVFDEGDDSHPATTIKAKERVHFIDLADHLCPAFGGHMAVLLLLCDGQDYFF